jgi:hypothetical protein
MIIGQTYRKLGTQSCGSKVYYYDSRVAYFSIYTGRGLLMPRPVFVCMGGVDKLIQRLLDLVA